MQDHDLPFTSFPLTQPDAFKDVPASDSSMYVPIEVYPIAFAARAAAPYSIEQDPFGEPSIVQSRVTSAVYPSSSPRATGRPTTTAPTIPSSERSEMLNLCPTTDLWWRWCSSMNSLAALRVMGASQTPTDSGIFRPVWSGPLLHRALHSCSMRARISCARS